MACCGGDDEEEQQRTETTRVRGCTDIFWLCLFIAFWFLMIIIAAFAFVYGNPIRLINGYDSFGNVCGVKNNPKLGKMELSGQDTSDRPYLFFFNASKLTHLRKSLKICVKHCPDRDIKTKAELCQFWKDKKSKLCLDKPGATDDTFSICDGTVGTMNITCPSQGDEFKIHNSKPILNRCVPKSVTDATRSVISSLNSWDVIEQILGDLYKTWKEIVALTFLSFVLSLFMIAIFHLLASFVTWIVMILVFIACGVGTGLLWWTYFDIKHQLDQTDKNELLTESVRNETAFLTMAIVATIFTVILIFLICFIRKRISFMAALFRESAKCLAELPGLFFQPLLTFIALLVFFAFWVTVVLCLATANYPTTHSMNSLDDLNFNSSSVNDKPVDDKQKPLDIPINVYKTFTLVEYIDSTWIKYMWWVYIIGLIWISEFITACQTMTISGAVAHWYFRGKDASSSPTCSSMSTLVTYHLGSVACGSFLITVFKLPRLILTWMHAKFEKTKETSPCAQCGLKCCICCFYCLERFIRFMNHNAYTVVAIEGTHFCNAARIAFQTIVSNALQVAVINGVGDFILFLGKCFVAAATGSIGLLFMRQDQRLHLYAVPVFVTFIFAYFVAHCVISLYETVIDTLFLCVCEDKNLNGDNGKWRQSALAQLATNSNTNGQQSHELDPMNT